MRHYTPKEEACYEAAYRVLVSEPISEITNLRYSKRCITVLAIECGREASFEVFQNGRIERLM